MSLFLQIFEEFHRHQISYVVVGGLAVVMHGHARLTADVDIILDLKEENAGKAIEIITALGYIPRAPVNPQDFANEKIRLTWIREKGLTVFSFYQKENPLIGVDFFVEYPIDYEQLYACSEVKDLGGIPLRICSIEHLIMLKEKVGRTKDKEDIRMLTLLKNESKTK